MQKKKIGWTQSIHGINQNFKINIKIIYLYLCTYICMGLWNIHDKRKHDTSKVVVGLCCSEPFVVIFDTCVLVSLSRLLLIASTHLFIWSEKPKPDSNCCIPYAKWWWVKKLSAYSKHPPLHFTSLHLCCTTVKWNELNETLMISWLHYYY